MANIVRYYNNNNNNNNLTDLGRSIQEPSNQLTRVTAVQDSTIHPNILYTMSFNLFALSFNKTQKRTKTEKRDNVFFRVTAHETNTRPFIKLKGSVGGDLNQMLILSCC